MKSSILLLPLLLVTLSSTGRVEASSSPSAWIPVAQQVAKSIVYIESAEGRCTGIVIDSKRDYVLTAAHCIGRDPEGKDMTADSAVVKIVAKDKKKDLLVLEVKGLGKPALHFAKDDPKIGEEVASYGYGYGLDRPLFRVAHVSDDKTTLPEVEGGPRLSIDAAFVPGQSGGPVVDLDGNIVMIVQLGNDIMGLGQGTETIKDRVGKYAERSN